jgi:pantoate--beta-alanine ligase
VSGRSASSKTGAVVRTLRTVRTVSAVRAAVDAWRRAGDTVAFVPTMGNLHAGHLRLAQLVAQPGTRVVMSIFVNPTQFGPGEDFASYPRTPAEDTALITAAGTVDLLFVPDAAEMYPFGLDDTVRVVLPALGGELEGTIRPGHFDGVASVVARLLNVVMPDVFMLGQKDYQQFILIQRMIADLHIPTRLQMGSTCREPDGLAMSSRNRYLDAEERRKAPALHAALTRVREALCGGATNFDALCAAAKRELERAGLAPDYVEVRRAADLAKPNAADATESRIVLGAARVGRVRLIDNLLI